MTCLAVRRDINSAYDSDSSVCLAQRSKLMCLSPPPPSHTEPELAPTERDSDERRASGGRCT
eukprot:3576426-Pyramimonas_sp.AAC.3